MLKSGDIVQGVITGIKSYGAFVKFEDGSSGLIHISEFSDGFVKKLEDFVAINDVVEVYVIEYNEKINKYNLSLKRTGTQRKMKKDIINLSIGFTSLELAMDGWIKQKEEQKNE